MQPSPRFLSIRLATVCALGVVAARGAQPASGGFQPDDRGHADVVMPFIKQNCIQCHGSKRQKGDLRLDTLPNDFLDPATAKKWAEVLNTVNSHEMPPEDEGQPTPESAGKFTDWLTVEHGRAERSKRDSGLLMRRINRAEYNCTIRDLVGVDFSPAGTFPEDAPAGGFDNIAEALTISPLQLELYYSAARRILDRAIVEGDQPPPLKWHFEPEEHNDGSDGARVKRDGRNVKVSKGPDPVESGFTVIHHAGWNNVVAIKDFTLPHEGEYIIRFRAAGRVPNRQQVIEAATAVLGRRLAEKTTKGPSKYYQAIHDADLEHVKTHRMYNYGPPRVKVTTLIGGVPKVVAEIDIDATEEQPGIYEIPVAMTRQKTSFQLEYSYSIPTLIERDWQVKRDFPVPLLLIDWVELESRNHAVWPPEHHRKLVGDAGNADEIDRARKILARFMPRAFRRLVTPQEIESRLQLFKDVRPFKPSFNEAIKVPLASVLTSPKFLFLVEPSAGGDDRSLTTFELATRLSYFLWSSMPDETLFRLASSGELRKPGVLAAQVDRMLADPKSEALVTNFAAQWLGLRKVGSNPPVNSKYPEYDRHLEVSMVAESEAFYREILQHHLDVRNYNKSDFVTINERLARFYGIPGVRGDHFRRLPAPPESHRGGIVTQASIHTITSNGTRTSPVSRGVWVLKTMLNTDPGLPVANAGEIGSKVPGIDKATVRQRLSIHRELASCARCHDKIDPLGFALENFDATGEWREREATAWNGRPDLKDPPIDASATMPDGTEFVGARGLQEELLKQQDRFLTGLSAKLHTYALGRELGFSDQPMVDAGAAAMKKHNYTLRSLIHAIVTSESFSSK